MFRIQNLLTYKDGKLSGPMSPFLLAQGIAKQLDISIHGLCRVWFNEDRTMHQINEGSKSRPEITGHDTIVIKQRVKSFDQYMMFVDTGCNAVPAFTYFSDEYEVTRTPIYDKQGFLRHLTNEEALMVFHEIALKDLAKPAGNLENTVFA